MTINRFEDAYAIVEEVNSPYVGVTLDQYHFYAMGSGWDTLEKADGKKIFVWHLNGTEDMPCGAYYNNDEKRLWPGAEGDCLRMRATQIPSRRLALTATAAPSRSSVRHTMRCRRRRT